MINKSIVIALVVTTITIAFTACKKNGVNEVADAQTINITTQSTISDNLTEDANNVFAQAVNDSANAVTLGARPVYFAGYYKATVSISPTTPGVFPKTMTIDFGASTTSLDGITRSGQIIAKLSGPFANNGTVDSLSFNNYIVNGYHKEGTITWVNQSSGGVLSWKRADSGTVTASDGAYWHHYGQLTVTQTAGFGDNNLMDNVYSIQGSHTISNSDGDSGTSIIFPITPLEKKASCLYIDEGQLVIALPNGNQVLIDFGDGSCDNQASYSYNNGSFHTFTF